MKKIKNLSESYFLKFFFAFMVISLFVGAVCMPDRADMFAGLWRIATSPAKLTSNYFAVGGFAGTFLNMALVGSVCLSIFCLTGSKANNVSTLAFLLTVGFCAWGINILNIWPGMLGVVLYALSRKEKIANYANAMLFTTGFSPVTSEFLLRWPNAEAVGFTPMGIVLALAVGVCMGFVLPAGLKHAPNVHKGFDLYSAAVPVGMTAFMVNAVFYKTMGIPFPAAVGTDMTVANATIVNIFCCAVFGLCIVFAFWMGCRPRDYWELLVDPALVTNFSSTYGNAVFLMNVGVYGLFILGYYNLIGASFNGVTFGVIFCMLACCNSGSHPNNVWPLMVGYVAAASFFGWLGTLLGGTFTQAINAQAIIVGMCYANGLSPIADKYGWRYGFIAAVLHYCMVTTVPRLHEGLCLYNGGLTAALVCLLMVPWLESLARDKFQRKADKAKL